MIEPFDFKEASITFLAPLMDLPVEEVRALGERPPRPELGDFAIPCFSLAKKRHQAPQAIAKDLVKTIESQPLPSFLIKVQAEGAFVNLFYRPELFAKKMVGNILTQRGEYGRSRIGEGKNVVVDYSSANIAKRFHVGHACSTLIGNAICNLKEFLHYNTIRCNYLGDYGTQFGKLIVAYRKYSNPEALEADPIEELTRIYVKFHEEAEVHPELEEEARAAFKALEEKKPEELALWEKFCQVSLAAFQKTYDRLGVRFDNFKGEAFFAQFVPEVLTLLKEKELLTESEGAQVVDLEAYGLNPCIIIKSDGASIYATRDLAAILYRKRTWDFSENLYVVGKEQKNHFKQVFAVMDRLGFPDVDKCRHITFGLVKFKDAAFSTRKGNAIQLNDLLDHSVERIQAIIDSNMPDESPAYRAELAEIIGVDSVIFTYVKNSRDRDILFDWDEILDFEGDTAPYLLYAFARGRSVLEKAIASGLVKTKEPVGEALPEIIWEEGDFELLISEEEQNLLRHLEIFPNRVLEANKVYEPCLISKYLLDLARLFNRFYHGCPILTADDPRLIRARLGLTEATALVLQNGLKILGLKTVNRM